MGKKIELKYLYAYVIAWLVLLLLFKKMETRSLHESAIKKISRNRKETQLCQTQLQIEEK